MTMKNPAPAPARSLAWDWINAARYYLGGRRGMLIMSALVIAGGLALNWSWLVAAGIAPLLIGVLPCVAMCALGLCMHKMGGQSCSTGTAAGKAADPAPDDAPSTPSERISTGQPNPPPTEKSLEMAKPNEQWRPSEPAKTERSR
jgi:hypothetical protein